MGTIKPAGEKTKGWRLGDNAKFWAWVKSQTTAELYVPRLDIATGEYEADLRILFVALYPYEFNRFKVGIKRLNPI